MPEIYIEVPFLMDIAKYIYGVMLFFRKFYSQPRTFLFNGDEYIYFEHPYNGTWMNERAVEISLIKKAIDFYPPEKVLEVGNVLSHYYDLNHTVVDKFERRSGVISQDILDVNFDRKFDFVISISTVEHIGWDELPRVPEKTLWAIEKMRRLLSENGKLMITIPLGHNTYLDQVLYSESLGCDQMFFFKRLTRYTWLEVGLDQVYGSTYGKKYRSTDGLAICIWHASQNSQKE